MRPIGSVSLTNCYIVFNEISQGSFYSNRFFMLWHCILIQWQCSILIILTKILQNKAGSVHLPHTFTHGNLMKTGGRMTSTYSHHIYHGYLIHTAHTNRRQGYLIHIAHTIIRQGYLIHIAHTIIRQDYLIYTAHTI